MNDSERTAVVFIFSWSLDLKYRCYYFWLKLCLLMTERFRLKRNNFSFNTVEACLGFCFIGKIMFALVESKYLFTKIGDRLVSVRMSVIVTTLK